jgi:alpha-1,3/alpha-1,6-mannosyltransferase
MLSQKTNSLKKFYRVPIDWIEETTTKQAHRIVVNSGFTASVFKQGLLNHLLCSSSVVNNEYIFPAFPTIKTAPAVLYPPINLEAYDKSRPLSPSSPFSVYLKKCDFRFILFLFFSVQTKKFSFLSPKKIVLSFNRFERKKNIGLAVKAYAELKNSLSASQIKELQLIVAGGYDKRVAENVEHLNELCDLATSLELTHTTLWR